MARTPIIALLGLASACAEPTHEPVEPPSTTSVRFAIADGVPLAFGDVPFPSDLYRDDDGRIALGAFPNPIADGPMFAELRAELGGRTGFCTSCAITFTIDGELLEDTIPRSAEPGTIATLDDSIALVDVDPDSPELGQSIPLRVQFEPALGRLSVRPARGAVLHGSRRYAAVLTTALRGADDLPLAAAPDFAATRDGDASDPVLERASTAIEPALAALEELGLDRESIVGLASFTTEDPGADIRSIRAALHASAAPVAIVDRVWTGAEIDELLGTVATPGAGIDREPAAGTEGTSAISHETTAMVVSGRFAAPRFVAGAGTDVGALARDEQGRPTATGTDDVPFVLVIPHDVDLRSLPVVISHHGFNASRTTGFALSDTAGAAGFAVLAIDAYQHGARAATADDRLHAMRGTDGPDGFAEASTLDVSMRVFGLVGVPTEQKLYPGYPLAAFEQFAADAMSTVRFVREGDLSALRTAAPELADLAFDPDRIAYVGNSMGAVVGTAVVVAEPDVHAFVLDVMPGSIVETLAESGEFRPLMDSLLLPQLGVEGEFDEVERELVFDPTVDLVR
jgi:pimeloyl-ACP methyl ester carboxylesterase